MDDPAGHRFYGELAEWWPLISPVEDYAEEARYLGDLLSAAGPSVREVLELGSGGGHCAHHLTQRFTFTLVDLSDRMLDVSRRLNPGSEHIQGDMRTMRLGRTFDAVLVHDAIDYMTTEDDLRQALETAVVHCRPGGVAVFVPDHTREMFAASADHDGSDSADGRGVRFLEWSWDPDPADTWTQTDYAFVLRERDGSTRVVHESHRCGLFDRATWLRLLAEAGFDAEIVREETTDDDREPRDVFVGRRR